MNQIHSIPLETPEGYNVIIEIPTGSSNKYEIDETTGLLVLDYVFKDNFSFPFNYGSFLHTRAEDNDPIDACVLSSYPIVPLTIVTVKPIAILKLKDRGEQDNKIVCVPVVDPLAEKYNNLEDLSEKEQQKIIDFFVQIGVQKQKTMEIQGFHGRDEAINEINRYKLP